MRGRSIQQIREKALRDVEQIRKTAAFILELLPDNTVAFSENENPGLHVIVIIGPVKAFSARADKPIIIATQDLEKAVLVEIGISQTYPNRRAKRLNRDPGEVEIIPRRQKWFVLTKNQYQIVAPIAFHLVEVLAYKRVINWEYGLGGKSFFYQNLPCTIKRNPGASFSITKEDQFFLQDLYWAELNLNQNLIRRIKGIVGSIYVKLKKYSSSYKGKKPFANLKKVKSVRRALESNTLSRRYLWEVIHILQKRRYQFWFDIADMLKWTYKQPEERILAAAAVSEFTKQEVKARLDRIQLRVVTELDAGRDYVLFEVYPRDFRKEK